MSNINHSIHLSDLRISALLPNTFWGNSLKLISPVLDRILGINKLRNIYIENKLSGLEKQTFAKQLLTALGVEVLGGNAICNKIPTSGKCIVVCNHPYGMVEGVIIAKLLTTLRADTKIMANVGLKVFKEINDYFIFANPLQPKASMNTTAIKQCFGHLKKDGLLVVFPAGKVSFFQKNKQRITDGEWNRLTVGLATKTNAPILPLFISGNNSPLFHRLGRVYYRFRLLMLAHEMFKLREHKIMLSANNLLQSSQLKAFKNTEAMNGFIRAQCYLNDEKYYSPWHSDISNDLLNKEIKSISKKMASIIKAVDKIRLETELEKLPAEQHLLDFKSFSVYYGYQEQIPLCVQEITRLREVTFRTLDEGSGLSCDTDKFDATYMHLFIFDHSEKEIIGAYRIGQTDILQKRGDKSQLYLSQMFNFSDNFINQQQPCLEMGRSFIVEKHQNSFHGLLLLWKGIGAFVCKNPHYRTMYGTVSLSKLYDPRSVSLINTVMVTEASGVAAKTPFNRPLHPEVTEFLQSSPLNIEQLSAFVTGIEDDSKDIPILLKQYHKLGAVFHCTGIDNNFNETPGLLLSVDLPKAPEKLLKLYLGDNRHDYINFKPED